MNIIQIIISKWKSFSIELQRGIDHNFRRLIGVPTLKRSMISPQLFLGGQYSSRGFSLLKRRGITGIVSMRLHPRKGLPELGEVEFLHLPTKDMQAPTIGQLQEGVAFIARHIQNGGKVYVHCAAGEGRGPTMVAAYLISTGLTQEDALSQIRKVRSFIRPTRVQLERLKEWEQISGR